MQLVDQAKLDAAMAKAHPGLSQERKEALVAHIRGCREDQRAATHQILSVHLPAEELAFYNDIVIPPPDDSAAAAPAAQPDAPAPAPEAGAIAETEGASSAKSTATRHAR